MPPSLPERKLVAVPIAAPCNAVRELLGRAGFVSSVCRGFRSMKKKGRERQKENGESFVEVETR